MFAVEGGKTPVKFARSQHIRIPQGFLSRPSCPISTSPSYVSFVSKAILWERGLCNHRNHSVPQHGSLLCSRFLSHMKIRPEDLKPSCFLYSKSRPLPLCQEKQCVQPPSSPTNQQTEGHLDLKANKRYVDFHHDPVPGQSAAVAPGPSRFSTTALPRITPKPCDRISSNYKRPPKDATPRGPPSPQTFSTTLQDTLFGKTKALVSNISDTNSVLKLSHSPPEPESPQSPDSLSLGSCSDLSCPSSSLSSPSLDPMTGRSSFMSGRTSAESRSTGPEGINCSPPVHSSRALQTPVAPSHASLPLFSPANQSSHSLISPKSIGQTKAPSLPQTSPVAEPEPKGDEADIKLKCPYEETQFELCHKTTSGHNISVPVSAKSSCPPSQLMPSAEASLKVTPSRPVSRLGSPWPVLPPIPIIQDRCNTAASYSSEPSCSQSQVFDELDAIAPLSVSCSSIDQSSESSHCPSKNADVLSPGLAVLTVGCDSGNLGSLSRVQLLLLNRQETYAASPFSLDEDLISMDNNPDLEMINGVWRPLTAGSISEKCGSTGKAHQNKLDDMERCSGSSCSWIIDPSPSYNIIKSSDSQCNSSLGSLEHEVAPVEQPSNYSGFAEEDEEGCLTIERSEEDPERKREQRKTKALKMLSKLQDDAPHQSTSSKGHANFEDFDFLAKYCIFNQERLTEYKRAFEEEDGDGDGYISCLQVLCALKSIIPPELLSEEEEIYVYRILEMVDFRVTDGLVDLRLFAVIASLAQKIATMDDFMRSLISNIDFRSLEVKLFKAKKLFLFLLEEVTDDGTSQQMYISPEQVILELKAGGICLEQEAVIRMEIQHIPPLDLLDFLAYLPLFMLIHKSVIANPLEDFSNL